MGVVGGCWGAYCAVLGWLVAVGFSLLTRLMPTSFKYLSALQHSIRCVFQARIGTRGRVLHASLLTASWSGTVAVVASGSNSGWISLSQALSLISGSSSASSSTSSSCAWSIIQWQSASPGCWMKHIWSVYISYTVYLHIIRLSRYMITLY